MTQPQQPRGAPLVGVPLGRYRGVPLRAHWSVLFTALLVAEILAAGVLPSSAPHHSTGAYWAVGVLGAIVFLSSLLAHELMHAVAARHYGVRVDRITLWLLGGMAEIAGDPPTPRAAAVIAAAGPATSIAVGVVFGLGGWAAAALGLPTLIVATLMWLGVTNGILGLFNLLPGAPLDGGRLLQALLWRRYHDAYRATVTATRVGRALGIGLVAVGVLEAMLLDIVAGLWLGLIGWFLVSAARSESTAATMRAILPGRTVGDLARPLPEPVPSWWTVAHLREMREATEVIHGYLPVVDFDGRAIGIVSWRDVGAHGDLERDEATLGALSHRLPVLAADADVLAALHGGAFSHGAVLVQGASGQWGLLAVSDLQKASAMGAAHHGTRQ